MKTTTYLFIVPVLLIGFSVYVVNARINEKSITVESKPIQATNQPLITQPSVVASSTPTPRKEIIKYTIKPGDTISGIADQFKLSITTILSTNNLTETSLLKLGDQLLILPFNGVLYQVRAGDTFSSISKAFNIPVEEIQKANDLTANNALKINQELILPGATKKITIKQLPSKTSTKPKTATPKAANSNPKTSSQTKTTAVTWSISGLSQLNKIPSAVRPSVKAKITNYAKSHGIKVITKKVYLGIRI